MKKGILGASAGATIGGVALPLIAMIGGDALVMYPAHSPGSSGMQDWVNYGNLVFKLALILGISSGAIAGAVVGSAGDRGHREP